MFELSCASLHLFCYPFWQSSYTCAETMQTIQTFEQSIEWPKQPPKPWLNQVQNQGQNHEANLKPQPPPKVLTGIKIVTYDQKMEGS